VLNFAQEIFKAMNDKEKLDIACKHFEKVYNRKSSDDPSIINEIPHCPESIELDQLPKIKELDD
jgi:hypothetical protein